MKPGPSKPTVYCEKGAYAPEVKRLWRAGRINLIHFPYDSEDRRWHDKQKIPFARPSLVTINTDELRITDPTAIQDTEGSDLYRQIARVLGKHPREFDVRHLDSAYKSGTDVFVTRDGNFHVHADELYQITGVRVVAPELLEALIVSWPR
jgi:hypothetical protein